MWSQLEDCGFWPGSSPSYVGSSPNQGFGQLWVSDAWVQVPIRLLAGFESRHVGSSPNLRCLVSILLKVTQKWVITPMKIIYNRLSSGLRKMKQDKWTISTLPFMLCFHYLKWGEVRGNNLYFTNRWKLPLYPRNLSDYPGASWSYRLAISF